MAIWPTTLKTGRSRTTRPLGLVLTGCLLSMGHIGAAADDRAPAHSYIVRAEVVSVDPVRELKQVEQPERHCEPVRETHRQNSRYSDDYYDEYDDRYSSRHQSRRRGSTGARVIGGLIGGAVGNQFGDGNGRRALTIAGALLGSAIAGGRAERRSERRYEDDRRFEPEYYCRTTTRTRVVEQTVGFDVTYRYNNQLYQRRTDYDPGDTIELRVRAEPEVSRALVPSAVGSAFSTGQQPVRLQTPQWPKQTRRIL